MKQSFFSSKIKPKYQDTKKLRLKNILIALLFVTFYLFLTSTSYAFADPFSVPNNKFGIHVLTDNKDDASSAASLVNSASGDWGYITVLIESGNRDVKRWQEFFNYLRKAHLIPIIRIATQPQDNFWKKPYEGEEIAWADFLDNLIWPTKNRYVVIYNEPNHSKEWGNQIDPADYALTLDKTINALKAKSEDFFVLNAGFDASTPQKPPNFYNEENFLEEMERAVPGIFNKLDGWVSHSYPNPDFSGSPDAEGKGTVRTWQWELNKLKELGVNKNLPVFITETGWKHAEGINFNPLYPISEVVGENLKSGFENAWSDERIMAVTPFLLNYQQPPFDHFSFKKLTGEKQNTKILGATFPDYYPQYQTLMDLNKKSGLPDQDDKAELSKGEVYNSIVAGENYTIPLTFKNTGQSIWNERDTIKLVPNLIGNELGLKEISIDPNIRVEPGQEYTFNLNLKAPKSGTYNILLNLYNGDKAFDNLPFLFTTEVKPSVILKINSNLKWKKTAAGEYLLTVTGVVSETIQKVILNDEGISDEIEAKHLLPDYPFDFTLQKPFYKPKTIRQTVRSGVNILNFGTLEPDIVAALLNPRQLWKLFPFSR